MRLTPLGSASWNVYATSPSAIFQALTKFLKCVNWDLPQEAKQALELLGKWRPMDVEDSLELLSSQFTNPTVRRYAVARLQQADDEVGRKALDQDASRPGPGGLRSSQDFCPTAMFAYLSGQRSHGDRSPRGLGLVPPALNTPFHHQFFSSLLPASRRTF